MLKTVFKILLFLCCPVSTAQSDSILKFNNHHFNLKLGYISSVIYPGICSGIEFPVKTFSVGTFKKRQGTNSRLVSGSLNWYHHPDFHDNLYLTLEWIMRRINSDGLVSEVSFGPGLSRTFLQGTTYRVSENGNISVVRSAGYKYMVVTAGGGLGYDFSVKKNLPISAFTKFNILMMFPYNSTVYIRPVLEFGIRCSSRKIFRNKPEIHSNL